MKIINLLVLALPVLAFAQKKETEVTAKIKEVLVYTSSAEVYYEKKILVPKGQSVVMFTELTPYIAENTVNVSLSDPGVNIVTVTELINYTKEKRNSSDQVISLQDSIRRIRKESGLIACKREAVEKEKELLFKGEAIGGLSTQGVLVAEIEKASSFFSKRYYELTKELYELKDRGAELDEREKRYQNQIKELTTVTQQTTSEIKILVKSPAEKEVTFNLKFLTTRAGWAPMYDFKYEGPTAPIGFVFRANVFNASGTNWEDVKIRLSTADPGKGFKLPSLNDKGAAAASVSGVAFKQVEIINAITEYNIQHQYTIPSDAKPYLVEVDAYDMPASFNYLLIPKLDPFGFLMAKVPGWNRYNLIPGTANIYNSGMYMGKTFLDTYAQNDTLSLFLGKDKRIQSNRKENSTIRKNFIAGNYSVEETEIEMTVKNTSADMLPVDIIDQVPYFDKEDDEKISMYGLTGALYDKTDGMIRWSFKIKPEETISLKYKYEIKSPKNIGDGYRAKKRKFRTIACPSF
ncbi:MAG: hypothetical protein K0S33_1793 [Bacteroidetes bacterium]|jgi:hypothetical protein|nr:hypothetical protein [Bacteroidota bacterium]